jgi:hypothetical protein
MPNLRLVISMAKLPTILLVTSPADLLIECRIDHGAAERK